jgi:hypothetical protein
MDRATKNFRIWFAGFFDGEGSIGIYMTSRPHDTVQFEPILSVYQRDEWVIELIRARLGGVVHRAGGNNPDHRGWGLKWSWRKAIRVARYIQPYSIRKKAQIDAFLGAMKQFGRFRGGYGCRLPDDIVSARTHLANSVNLFNAVPGSEKRGPKPKTTPSEAAEVVTVANDDGGTCDGHTPDADLSAKR